MADFTEINKLHNALIEAENAYIDNHENYATVEKCRVDYMKALKLEYNKQFNSHNNFTKHKAKLKKGACHGG